MKRLLLLALLISPAISFANYAEEEAFNQQQELYNQEQIMDNQRKQMAIEQQNQEDLEMMQAMQANQQGY